MIRKERRPASCLTYRATHHTNSAPALKPASRLAQMDEDPFLVAEDDIRTAVAVQIGRCHLGADPGIVINQVGNESGLPANLAPQFKPIEQGGRRLNLLLAAQGSASTAPRTRDQSQRKR